MNDKVFFAIDFVVNLVFLNFNKNILIYAKKVGITYKTAHKHWKQGLIKGYQLPTGTIVVEFNPENILKPENDKVILYSRVSSSANKKNLETQNASYNIIK